MVVVDFTAPPVDFEKLYMYLGLFERVYQELVPLMEKSLHFSPGNPQGDSRKKGSPDLPKDP